MATAITRITGRGIATGMHGYVAGAKSNARVKQEFCTEKQKRLRGNQSRRRLSFKFVAVSQRRPAARPQKLRPSAASRPGRAAGQKEPRETNRSKHGTALLRHDNAGSK